MAKQSCLWVLSSSFPRSFVSFDLLRNSVKCSEQMTSGNRSLWTMHRDIFFLFPVRVYHLFRSETSLCQTMKFSQLFSHCSNDASRRRIFLAKVQVFGCWQAEKIFCVHITCSLNWSSNAIKAIAGLLIRPCWSGAEVRLLSIFVDSKDLLADVAMMNLLGTPCFESRCMTLSPNGLHHRRWTLPSTARRLKSFASLQTGLLNPWRLPYSIYRSRSLLGCGRLFLCMMFLWNGIFSLLQPRDRIFSVFFSFLLCMHVPAAEPTKSDTARCHWQREVNSDIGARCHRQRSVLWNACTRVPDQNVCVTSRSMWEPLLSTVIWSWPVSCRSQYMMTKAACTCNTRTCWQRTCLNGGSSNLLTWLFLDVERSILCFPRLLHASEGILRILAKGKFKLKHWKLFLWGGRFG